MSEEINKGNVVFKLDETKLELNPSAIRTTIIEGQILRIFDGRSVNLFDTLGDGDIVIRDADIKSYERGFNSTLDTMLKSIGLRVIAIVDNDGNHLVEISR